MEIRIGDSGMLDSTPELVTVGDRPFILTTTDGREPTLFKAICPHQEGTVGIKNEGCLRCPDHGWEFNAETGESTTVPGESLTSYSIWNEDGFLYADIPDVSPDIEFSVDDHNGPTPTVSLLSHASLSIEYDGFRLVTDPWLDGPAFLGGWTQYPQPTHDVEEIAADTDALWITHEHSDHLNERTLSHFASDTPIYVPELNYRRLSSRLSDLGFEHIHSLPTERAYELADGVEAVCFESASTWNDSILAVNCGGFKILNFNDAGLNWDVNRSIPEVDLIATSFAFGASGYPLTWEHVDVDEERLLMEDRNWGALQHCEQVVDMFNPDYLLPFAKFFTFFPPEHEQYRERIEQNRPGDVADHLSDTNIKVLDLYPGESWHGERDKIDRRADRDECYTASHERAAIKEQRKSQAPIVEGPFDLTHDELRAYFESLSGSQLAANVGNHALSISLHGEGRSLDVLIHFEDGEITCERADGLDNFGSVDSDTQVNMTCDGTLVQYVIRNNLSWDEVHIGYWCRFERYPDEYNLGFWRLLHAPWEAQSNELKKAESYDIQTPLEGIPIADLVEQAEINELLTEYGLQCAGCPTGLGEDLLEGARIHGLTTRQAKRLISRVEQATMDRRGWSPADLSLP